MLQVKRQAQYVEGSQSSQSKGRPGQAGRGKRYVDAKEAGRCMYIIYTRRVAEFCLGSRRYE